MKKTNKAAQAAIKRATQIERLAAAALEKYSVSEIMEALENAACKDEKTDLKWWAEYFLCSQANSIIINPQSIAEESRIRDFLDEMYPLMNEKQLVLPL